MENINNPVLPSTQTPPEPQLPPVQPQTIDTPTLPPVQEPNKKNKFPWKYFGLTLLYFILIVGFGFLYKTINLKKVGLGIITMFYISWISSVLFLISGIITSFVLKNKKWVDWKSYTKNSVIFTYIVPLIILIGGHFAALATNLLWEREGLNTIFTAMGGWGLNREPSLASGKEQIYTTIAKCLIIGGSLLMVILIIILIYTLIINARNRKKELNIIT